MVFLRAALAGRLGLFEKCLGCLPHRSGPFEKYLGWLEMHLGGFMKILRPKARYLGRRGKSLSGEPKCFSK